MKNISRSSIVKSLIELVDHLSNWKVAIILAVIGFIVFAPGLTGGFQGDDGPQIIDNVVVHSFDNVGKLFRGGTFWDGANLSGDFYRPVMSSLFSILYGLFGPNPIPFHITQLVLYVGAIFVLFLVLKRFFRTISALTISVLCLVHPLNTQVVYSIPCMQEPLFLLFGLSGLYLLMRAASARLYVLSGICLLISMLSKETGLGFVVVSFTYVLIYRRNIVRTVLTVLIPIVGVYLALRVNAIGLFHPVTQAAPIDKIGAWSRILMVPSLLSFYLGHLLWPAKLATSYYWTNSDVSLMGFLLPLLIVVSALAAVVYLYRYLGRTEPHQKRQLQFFGAWAIVGLLPVLQIVSLDMTACETWLLMSMPAIVSIAALGVRALLLKIGRRNIRWLYVVALIIVLLCAQRSFIRGFDYRSQRSLSLVDVSVDPGNYLALNNLAKSYIDSGDLLTARGYAERSIHSFPAVSNYTNLGVILQKQGNFHEAQTVYKESLKYGFASSTYENLAITYLATATPNHTISFVKTALRMYPHDPKLWTFLAVAYAQIHDGANAKLSIQSAAVNGLSSPGFTYIIDNQIPYDIPIDGLNKPIHIY